MTLSDQRLNEILEELRKGGDPSTVPREEWTSIAAELRQLRLRISTRSRSANSGATGSVG